MICLPAVFFFPAGRQMFYPQYASDHRGNDSVICTFPKEKFYKGYTALIPMARCIPISVTLV